MISTDHIKQAPYYTVVIPAFNEAEELPETLRAVKAVMAQEASPGELIVVDNNSTDRTASVALANGADRVVFEPMNQIARARNAGAAASRGTHLVFIDADTRVPPDLLNESLRLLRSGQYVGGGAVIEFEGSISAVGRFGIGLWERISKLTKIAAGSYLFCRADAFREIGGFDEQLYASEEVRLSRRLKKWGKVRKMAFTIIAASPARTSARKLQWYSGPQILAWVLLMLLFPIAVRWRSLCGFWYQRPQVHS